MSKPAVEFDQELWARIKRHSEAAGYSSPLEFVRHAIEKELEKAATPASEEEAARKLHGIGYLDFGRDI
jgi:metal-responsive CopG/Arc/MetJ family transcriptional regulator